MRRTLWMLAVLALLPVGCGPRTPKEPDAIVVHLYRHRDAWCFDRFQDGLVRQRAFEGDASAVDALAASIPGAAAGFDLRAVLEPGARDEVWRREDADEDTLTYARQRDGARLVFRRGVLSAPGKEPPETFRLSAQSRR